MVGMKIVPAFGQSITDKEKTFCCWKGHLYLHVAFHHFLIVVLILIFCSIKMARNNLVPIAPRHHRERLPFPATQILLSKPEINLQHGRFFITIKEFEARINTISFQLWKIQLFAKFVVHNYLKIKESHFVSGDLYMLAEFMSIFLNKEFVDSKGMFGKIDRQHPFQFLLILICIGNSRHNILLKF